MKHYDTAENFVVDYGKSFPKNPRPGQLFSRTDLNNQHFQYDEVEQKWKAIAYDPKMDVRASSTQERLTRPTRNQIKAIAESISPSGGMGQNNALSNPLSSTNTGVYVDSDRVKTEEQAVADEQVNSDLFVDGVFVGQTVQSTTNPIDVVPLTDDIFDEKGVFQKTSPCPQVLTTLVGLYAESEIETGEPEDGCPCIVNGLCSVVPSFTVSTKDDDSSVPEGAYKLTWSRPTGNTESIWNYFIEAVTYPNNFIEPSGYSWVGTISATRDPYSFAIVTGYCPDGLPLTVNKLQNKLMYIVNEDSGCAKLIYVTANTANTIVTENAIDRDIYGRIMSVYVVEPSWNYTSWNYNYRIINDDGSFSADRYADTYTYTYYSNTPKAYFRICAQNWWGQGAYTYTEGYKELYPVPYPPVFTKVEGKLGNITVEVSGNAEDILNTVAGYELAYTSTVDVTPTTCPSAFTYLWSTTGCWTFTTNEITYLYARTRIETLTSAWLGYGEAAPGQALEETIYTDTLTRTSLPGWPNWTAFPNWWRAFPESEGYQAWTTWSESGNPKIDAKYSEVFYGNHSWPQFYTCIYPTSAHGFTLTAPLQIVDPNTYTMYKGFYLGATTYSGTGTTGSLIFVGIRRAPNTGWGTSTAVIEYFNGRERQYNLVTGLVGVTCDWPGHNSFTLIRLGQNIKLYAYVNSVYTLILDYTVPDDVLLFTELNTYIGFYVGNGSASSVSGSYDYTYNLFSRNSIGAPGSYTNHGITLIKRLVAGYVTPIDPGLAVDSLKKNSTEEIASEFVLSRNSYLDSGNASSDSLQLTLDANDAVWLDVHNPPGSVIGTHRLLRADDALLSSLSDVYLRYLANGDSLNYYDGVWYNIGRDIQWHSSLSTSAVDRRVQVTTSDVAIGKLNSCYSRSFTINGNGNSSQYNVPLRFTFNTAGLVSAGKVETDGSGLHILDSTGEDIAFWWEPDTWNTSSTVFWAKLPEVPSGNVEFTMVYGETVNPRIMTNPVRTFEYFDDFTEYSVGASIHGQGGWEVAYRETSSDDATIATYNSKNCLSLTYGMPVVVKRDFAPSITSLEIHAKGANTGYSADPMVGMGEGDFSVNTGLPSEGSMAGLFSGYCIYSIADHIGTYVDQLTFSNHENYYKETVYYVEGLTGSAVKGQYTRNEYMSGAIGYSTSTSLATLPSGVAVDSLFLANAATSAANVYLDYIFVTKTGYGSSISWGTETQSTTSVLINADLDADTVDFNGGVAVFANRVDLETIPAHTGPAFVAASGDFYHVDPSGTTVKISRLEVEDLRDVSLSSPAAGETLVWTGSAWVNGSVSAAGQAPLYAEFSSSDVTSGVALVGEAPLGLTITRCIIEITTPFGASCTMTVGDDLDNDRLCLSSESYMNEAARYETEPEYAYTSATNVYLYFTGSAVAGAGNITLYFN